MNRVLILLVFAVPVLEALEAGGTPAHAGAQEKHRADSTIHVNGQILDGRGRALAQVTVQLIPHGKGPSPAARTDGAGRFFFDVAPGEYRLALRSARQADVPRFDVESGLFSLHTGADFSIALPFQAVTVQVQDLHGRGLAGVALTTTPPGRAAAFTSAGIDWKGYSTYADRASAPVTQGEGQLVLFLFPAVYDLTAHPPKGLGLADETVAGVSVAGALTQIIIFDSAAFTNRPPRADAGGDRTVRVGQAVQLDGSASTDPDGDPLSYQWRLALPRPSTGVAGIVDGSLALPNPVTGVAEIIDWGLALPHSITGTAELIDANTRMPFFLARRPGVYGVELVVKDAAVLSTTDRATLIVVDRERPSVFARVAGTERTAHSWMQDEQWPLYLGVGAMAVGQVVYVRAQYAGNADLIHPAQSLFDFGFNLAAYVMIDRFSDYAGVVLLQNWMLQAVINTSFGHPLIWPEEPPHYDLFGVDVPKAFYGDRRWVQLGVGVGLIAVPRLVRKLRRRG